MLLYLTLNVFGSFSHNYIFKKSKIKLNNKDLQETEITPEMIEAGKGTLEAVCPIDVAFPADGVKTAVGAVLKASLQATSRGGRGS